MEDQIVLIKQINADTTLSTTEKSKKIQQLMMNNSSLCTELEKSNVSKTCSHYVKSCHKFYFDCCGVYDPCKRCHMERNCTQKLNLSVSQITCSECETSQKPSNECTNCNIQFANSYCGICHIWTHAEMYHCDGCGICRLGKKENTYHCHNCEICLPKFDDNGNVNTHKCMKNRNKYKESNCVICLESVYIASKLYQMLNCSHFAHIDCLNKYVKTNTNCPCCKKTMCNVQWEKVKYLKNKKIQLDGLFATLCNIADYVYPNDILLTDLGYLRFEGLEPISSEYGPLLPVSDEHTESRESRESEPEEYVYRGYTFDNNFNIKIDRVRYVTETHILSKIIYCKIHCYDCEKKSITEKIDSMLECKLCGSFNARIDN